MSRIAESPAIYARRIPHEGKFEIGLDRPREGRCEEDSCKIVFTPDRDTIRVYSKLTVFKVAASGIDGKLIGKPLS